MPIYEYKVSDEGCDACREGFEVLQGIHDEPLEACPECGAVCERIVSGISIVTTERQLLSKSNLESKGFHMYKKAGDGVYEKAAGKGGPEVIRKGGD